MYVFGVLELERTMQRSATDTQQTGAFLIQTVGEGSRTNKNKVIFLKQWSRGEGVRP